MDYVIIVAGGKGLRMGSEIPKQFLPVAGKPILMRTIERFHEYDPALNIILVLPESQQAYWHQLCEEHHFDIKHQIANGGDTRFQSSKNGLALIPDDEDGVVGIHDGVRPFVSKEVIEECFETAREEYAAIPVYAVTLMISLPAHYAWFWLPTSLKRKTIYANMTNTSDSSVRKTAKISQKPRINNAKYHV